MPHGSHPRSVGTPGRGYRLGLLAVDLLPEAENLRPCRDDDLVDVDVRRTGHRPGHAVGDVVGRQRGYAFVDRCRPLLVSAEADQAELRLHQPWGDLDDPDRLAPELAAKWPGDGACAVLGRRVTTAALVDVEAGDRPDGDDASVPAGDQLGEQRPGRAQDAED